MKGGKKGKGKGKATGKEQHRASDQTQEYQTQQHRASDRPTKGQGKAPIPWNQPGPRNSVYESPEREYDSGYDTPDDYGTTFYDWVQAGWIDRSRSQSSSWWEQDQSRGQSSSWWDH